MKFYKKGDKKLLNAWAFYDWANSVYSLVISSAIFPIYYGAIFSDINTINILGYQLKNTAVISFLTAVAFLIIAFFSPILSGIADYIGDKKKFMKIFVYIGSLSCIGLYWFELETIYLGLIFYKFSSISLQTWGLTAPNLTKFFFLTPNIFCLDIFEYVTSPRLNILELLGIDIISLAINPPVQD